MLELLKIIVQPVVLERDPDGIIVGEKVGEPTPLYSEEQVVEFLQTIKGEIVKQNANLVVPSKEIIVPE